MAKKNNKQIVDEAERLSKQIEILQRQLKEAKEFIKAIKKGEIDAVVIAHNNELKVYTEKTADKIFRIQIEKMNEGAVTLNNDGTILYCNSAFAKMVKYSQEKITGTKFRKFIDESTQERFNILIKQDMADVMKQEIDLYANDGKTLPVLMSVNSLRLDNIDVISILLTDLTVPKKNQNDLKRWSTELEQKNFELLGALHELAFLNEEKEKRAAELTIANRKLAIESEEKEKRAVELTIANLKLSIESKEKEKRAAELTIANRKLATESKEKEKRAAELTIANRKLAIESKEKEKRAAELSIANKDLTTFTYVSSHDLQEPLRKIQNFVSCILQEEEKNLSETGKEYFRRMSQTANRMQALIEDLLEYSGAKKSERNFEITNLNLIFDDVIKDFENVLHQKNARIEIGSLCKAPIIPFQFRQLVHNLVSNSLKFSKKRIAPHITVKTEMIRGSKVADEKLSPEINYCHIIYADNGIGFSSKYNERIFEVFQRLHGQEKYLGTGIGLAICKRIIENHNGIITASGKLNKGTRFDIYIPASQK